MSKDNGGPAFPDGSTNEWGNADNSGMSLRDYFAAHAMQGLFANSELIKRAKERHLDIHEIEEGTATEAYAIADAMLEARK